MTITDPDSLIRKGLWQNTLSLSVAGLVTTLLGIARALLLPKLLATPADYGLLLIVNLIAGFGIYAHLGVTTGVYRQIPYLQGSRAGEEEISRLRDSGLGFVSLTSLLATLAVLLISGRGTYAQGPVYAIVILGGAAMVLLRNLTGYLTNLYQAERRFITLARLEVVYSVSSVLLTLTAAYLWGVGGIVVAQVGIEAAFVLVYKTLYGKPLRPRIEPRRVWRVLKIGLPLTLVALLRYALESTDAVFIARFIGGDPVGFFRLAMILGGFVNLVPGKLGTVMTPVIAYQTGSRDTRSLMGNLLRFTEVNTLLSSLIAALGVVTVRVLLPVYLPNYTPAEPLAYVYMARMVFYSSIMVSGNTLVNQLLERKAVWRWIVAQVAFVLAAVALAFWTYLARGSILSLVVVNSSVIGVYALVLAFFSVRELGGGRSAALGFLRRLLTPALVFSLAAIAGWWVTGLLGGLPFLARWPIGLVTVLLVASPFLVYQERKLGVFKRLWRGIIRREDRDATS